MFTGRNNNKMICICAMCYSLPKTNNIIIFIQYIWCILYHLTSINSKVMWLFLYFSHRKLWLTTVIYPRSSQDCAISVFLIPQEQALLLLINSLDLHNNPSGLSVIVSPILDKEIGPEIKWLARHLQSPDPSSGSHTLESGNAFHQIMSLLKAHNTIYLCW